MFDSRRKCKGAAAVLLVVAAAFPIAAASAASAETARPSVSSHSVSGAEVASSTAAAQWVRWTAFFNRERCEESGKYMVDSGMAVDYRCIYEGWPVWALWVLR